MASDSETEDRESATRGNFTPVRPDKPKNFAAEIKLDKNGKADSIDIDTPLGWVTLSYDKDPDGRWTQVSAQATSDQDPVSAGSVIILRRDH